jgi:IS1 family transposase
MDELWSFLTNKNHQLWVFIAFDVPSKLWINFELGSRTNHTASCLVSQVKSLGNWTKGQVLKITTDKLAAYKNALSKHFVEIPYYYLQIVKKTL